MNKYLETILVKKSKLDNLLVNKNNWKVLNDWLKIELAYTSNAIEGNTLTRKETSFVITEGFTSGSRPIKDYVEARNHSLAYDFISDAIDNKISIDEDFVKAIHKIILTGINDENAGRYRNVRVRISGSSVVMPNYIKVPELMKGFIEWLQDDKQNIVFRAIEAHFRLVSIHPFIDGNGRTSRLLMNMILMKYGYSPIIIRKIDRRRYLLSLEKYQLKNDKIQYENFMLGALSRSFSMLIDLLSKDQVDPAKLLTIAQFADLAGLPVSTIRYWVNENKLIPTGYTPNGYMLFDKSKLKDVKVLKKL